MNPCILTGTSPLLTVQVILLVLAATATASPMVRRSAEFSTNITVPADATEEEIYDAKYKIWVEMLNFALDYKMSMVCRTIIRSAPAEGGPKEGCEKVLQHKSILGYACSETDIQIFEDVACGFDNIVVRKLPLPATTASPLTPLPRMAVTSAKSSISSSSSSSTSTSSEPSSSGSSSTSTTTQSTDAPSTEKMVPNGTSQTDASKSRTDPMPDAKQVKTNSEQPGAAVTPRNATSPDTVGSEPSTAAGVEATSTEENSDNIPTHDSRLSEACNEQLTSLAQTLSKVADQAQIQSMCHKLNQLARGDDSTSSSGDDPLLASCSEDELPLFHDTLCASQVGKPTHALQGQQQKRVNYVIKTELTASCRSALSPLGENQMEEDVEDSCLTLSGAQGDELVTNDLCTRGDLDNLLKVVCDSAPGILTPDYRSFMVVTFSVLVSLLRAYL